MSELRLDLFDRRFDDLIETGRARIPNLAPGWTDHNLHDPGIMLMELLAWTAEAQIYALSRQRKDERIAYAAMLGALPRGPQPASGLLWPAGAPPAGSVIRTDTGIGSSKQDAPLFWLSRPILLAPAQVETVRTLLADGGEADHTGANRLGGAGFEPFGPAAGRGDVFEIGLRCVPGHQLLEAADQASGTDPARLSLGVRIIGPVPPDGAPPTPLRFTLVTPQGRSPVAADDGTAGFARSGAILLDLSGAAQLDACTLEITAPRGFARAPRVECIALNVLPVVQSLAVVREEHPANGMPDQEHFCDEVAAGQQAVLQFEPGTPAVEVWTVTRELCRRWSVRPDLDDSGPDDQHAMLDSAAARVVFGNGVNGMRPPSGASVLLSYRISTGTAGNLPRKLTWQVPGFDRTFFSNPDPMAGGADARTMDDLRRAARRGVRTDRALVTAKDIADAALTLTDLGVARAQVLGPDRRGPCRQPQGSTLTLLALRTRAPGDEAESARWLDAVRSRLAPRVPLGTRLRVVAPAYLRLRVNARLEASPMHNPATIEQDARKLLAKRLALTAPAPEDAWPFGAALSPTYVAAWLSKLEGVARVRACELLAGDSARPVPNASPAPLSGLLELDLDGSVIDVRRSGATP